MLTERQKLQIPGEMQAAQDLTGEALVEVRTAKFSGEATPTIAKHLEEADRFLSMAREKLTHVKREINEAVPAGSGSALFDALDLTSLSTLETLDSPDTRQLLALLEEAQIVAERVDASRGRAYADNVKISAGEPRGTDLAARVALLALRLRREVGGASSPHE